MRRLLTALAASTLLVSSATIAFADEHEEEPQRGPDFSACLDLDDETLGACISDIARDFRAAAAEAGQSALVTAGELTEACAELEGRDFGACVAEAAQARNDDEDGEENAAEVAALAQELAAACEDREGVERGECVREAAQELGSIMGQAGDHGQPENPGEQGAENRPADVGPQSAPTGPHGRP